MAPLRHPTKPPDLRVVKPWCLRLNLLSELLAFSQNFLLIHRHELVLIDYELSIANHSPCAASCSIKNEVADQVVSGRGDPFIAAQIPQDEIGLFADLNTTDFMFKLECLRAIDRGHVQDGRFRRSRRNLE